MVIELSRNVAVGDTTLHLTEVDNLEVSMLLTLSGGGNSQTFTIQSVEVNSSGRRLEEDYGPEDSTDREDDWFFEAAGRRLAAGSVGVSPPSTHNFNAGTTGSAVPGPTPTPAPTPPGAAVGDPLATYGNERVMFLLPVGVLTLLFESTHMKVFGTTFQGSHDEEQWIDRVVVTTKKDKKIIDMSIKKDLVHFNRSTLVPNAFETLNIVMWDARPTPLKVFPPPDGYFYQEGVTVAFLKQNWDREQDAPQRECAWIGTALSKVIVCSASAREHFGELGLGGRKYAHLDIEVVDMHSEREALSGVLPELWGIVPKSDTTKAYIKHSYTIPEPATDGTEHNGTVDLLEEPPHEVTV